MKQRVSGSMTVEAALIYPMLLMITFVLVRITVVQYAVVQVQAGSLYDAVFTERTMKTPELVRAADTAFEFFGT